MATATEVSETIRKARLRAGLSQERAAALVGVQRLQWIRWENGSNAPSDANRARVAEVLNVDEWRLEVEESHDDDPLTAMVREIVREEIARTLRVGGYKSKAAA